MRQPSRTMTTATSVCTPRRSSPVQPAAVVDQAQHHQHGPAGQHFPQLARLRGQAREVRLGNRGNRDRQRARPGRRAGPPEEMPAGPAPRPTGERSPARSPVRRWWAWAWCGPCDGRADRPAPAAAHSAAPKTPPPKRPPCSEPASRERARSRRGNLPELLVQILPALGEELVIRLPPVIGKGPLVVLPAVVPIVERDLGEDPLPQVDAMGVVLGGRQHQLAQRQVARVEVQRPRLGVPPGRGIFRFPRIAGELPLDQAGQDRPSSAKAKNALRKPGPMVAS